jgi:predicted nucleic acid-binding protein
VIVVDTGPLVAAAIADHRYNAACVALFIRMHQQRRKLLVPGPVPAEVGYMLHRLGGSKVEAAFLRSLRDGVFEVIALTTADWDRMAELVDTYADLPLGTADASVVAVAERLGIAEVATLDRRHFSVVRPKHVPAFTLLPR